MQVPQHSFFIRHWLCNFFSENHYVNKTERFEKMKKILLFCFLPINLLAQNLVVNPGFEELTRGFKPKTCTPVYTSDEFNNSLFGWKTLSFSTPDIISFDSEIHNCTVLTPREGKIYAGIITYLPKFDTRQDYDYHEFLQGTLIKPLQLGKQYRLQFWVQQNDTIATQHIQTIYRSTTPSLPLSSNNIGVLFSTRDISNIPIYKTSDLKPQINIDRIIAPKSGNWQLISLDFIADKPYRYFIIGNFYQDDETITDNFDVAAKVPEQATKNGYFVGSLALIKRIAYYCIDDVSIILVNENEETSIIIENNKPYTFKNVQFETGKWELLPGAEEELAKLVEFIHQNPDKHFEIAGHTDDVGDDAANQLLSEKRAKTVYDYLLQNNISKKQISYKGYGESYPVADNITPKGKQRNRRVECKIIE